MIQKSDLRIIEEDIRRLKGNLVDPEDEDVHRTAVVLVSASLGVGTDVDDLAEFTGYPRGFIAAISQRMNAAELWEDAYVNDDHWYFDERFEKIHLAGFWLDVHVGEGRLVAKRMEDGKFRYWTPRFAPWSQQVLM